jgi:hypothetical protein
MFETPAGLVAFEWTEDLPSVPSDECTKVDANWLYVKTRSTRLGFRSGTMLQLHLQQHSHD